MNLGDYLTGQFREAGLELKTSSADLVSYINQLAPTLRQAQLEPGYDKALHRATRATLEYAIGKEIDAADATDTRIWGVVATALTYAGGLAIA